MSIWSRFTAALLICGLAACSAQHNSPLPSSASQSQRPAYHLDDSASALPGDSASALPGDSASALPGDSASALPGDSASALPGASLSCPGTFEADQANCTLAINTTTPPNPNPVLAASLIPGLHPADLLSAYNIPAGSGNPTVAVVAAYDNPTIESDLATYRAAFALPACTTQNGCFAKVDERGGTSYPTTNSQWEQESSLDVEMVSAICPNCRILLVEADSATFDDLGASVNTAVAQGAKYVSNSYYGPEWNKEPSYDTYYHHDGVAITVSSGDQRSSFYPGASPYVTTVGGTTLTNSGGVWKQAAWAYDGAGCSKYERRPAWQSQTGCQYGRSMVDVAVVADPQTGVSMFNAATGGWLVAGGTSVGAPVVAAAYAVANNPQGPAFSYAHRSAFVPVGGGGYTQPAGLGSPLGVAGL